MKNNKNKFIFFLLIKMNNENLFQNEYNDSFSNSNDNCYINSYPLNNYFNKGLYYNSNFQNDLNYYNVDNKKRNSFKIKNKKSSKMFKLNDPKLLEAYNEGYYGVSNIPKKYYIYPKFSNIELKKKTLSCSKENQILKNGKENNIDIIFNKILTKNNYNSNNFNKKNTLSSYINYPYPRLINISSNFFGQFHLSDSKNENLNSNIYNNSIINKSGEKNEKENQNENNLKEENNKEIDISLRIKDKKNIKIKGSGKIISNSSKQDNYTETKKENTKKIININDNEEDLNDTGNFYYINNNITKRNVPYQNIPDNISIDDQEEDD